MATTTSRTFARASALVGALIITTSLFTFSTAGAHAAGTSSSAYAKTSSGKPTFASRVVATAASRKGSPYARGGDGPTRFDCSGLTKWTLARLHHKLPHSAAAQYNHVKHIPARYRKPGDLVFFHSGRGIYHVGIYVGKNAIWHAPRSGERVQVERIWTSSVYYGRIV